MPAVKKSPRRWRFKIRCTTAPDQFAATSLFTGALSMDNSGHRCRRHIALRRTPDTLNKLAEVYETITPEDIRQVARKYFDEANRTVVTLTGATK
jgi:predicted Zn-dependent peptidase